MCERGLARGWSGGGEGGGVMGGKASERDCYQTCLPSEILPCPSPPHSDRATSSSVELWRDSTVWEGASTLCGYLLNGTFSLRGKTF